MRHDVLGRVQMGSQNTSIAVDGTLGPNPGYHL